MPRARSRSRRPTFPGSSRRRSASSRAASCPIVSSPAARSRCSDLGPDAGELAHVERREKRRFPPRRHDEQPARLPQVARHLGDDLARRDTERAREARRAAHCRLHGLGHTPCLEEVRGDVGHVEVALVDAGALDRRHDMPHRVPDGARIVAVQRVSGRDEDRMRAAALRLGTAHRRVDAEAPRLVVRGCNDAAALRVASDDQRLPAQRRVLQLLDGCEEGIEIEMRDDHRNTPIRAPPQTMSPAATMTCRPISSLRPMITAASSTPKSASVAIERADDAHPSTVEGFEDGGVRQAPEHAGQGERAEGSAHVPEHPSPPQEEDVRGHHRRSADDRRRCGQLRIDRRVLGQPSDDVVASCKEHCGRESEHEADEAQMLGAVSLTREREDAEHDQHGAGDQRRLDRLVEDRECDRDGDERPGSRDDGCPRSSDLLHGHDVQELRTARRDEPGEQKRPEIAAVGERVQRERSGHTQRDQTGDERSRLGVRAPLERDAERRRHRTEEDGGNERQDDRGHRARLASPPETVEAENGRSAQVSCPTFELCPGAR